MLGELQKALGGNLRRIRLGRGLTQEQFAELLAVHRTYLGGLERGERNPTLLSVETLARHLQIEPLELLTAVTHPDRHRARRTRS